MRWRIASVMSISMVAWSALLIMPSPAKKPTVADRAEKPSLDVEDHAQEAADRADRATDDAVRMLDQVIIKSRTKAIESKTIAPDALLAARTKLALTADERVTGRQMTVEALNGIITLRGSVHSSAAKTAAEDTAKHVKEVKAVKDLLRIMEPPGQDTAEENDEVITEQVHAALKREPSLQKTDVAVQAEAGVVTLTGSAADILASAQAAWTAWKIKGVRAVKNELVVKNK